MASVFTVILKGHIFFAIQFTFNSSFAQLTTKQKKDSIVKTFYDVSANILTGQDTKQAKYFRIVKYRNGKITGPVIDYYMNGKPMMIGNYLNNNINKGNEDGVFTWYYEDGTKFQTCTYVNGVLDGAYIEYYPSGLKKVLIFYSNGKRYGCEYAWDEEGTVVHRAYMEENGVLYNREECDTTYLEKASLIDERSVGLSEVFLKEFADGEYKQIDSSLFYKSKGVKILSVTVLNSNLDTISSSQIRTGTLFRVHIRIIGFKVNKDKMCDCTQQEQQLHPDGNGGGSIGALYSQADENGVLEIRLGESPDPIYDDKVASKDYFNFFYVRDTKSKASIHGFYRYRVRY